MKRSYTKEFKVQACELVITEGIKPSVVAEKLGINAVMLYRWVDEYRTHGQDAFVGKGHQKPADAELRRLRKENERLREALIEIATDPRDDSVCVGDGWNFYSDVVDYARQVLEALK